MGTVLPDLGNLPPNATRTSTETIRNKLSVDAVGVNALDGQVRIKFLVIAKYDF